MSGIEARDGLVVITLTDFDDATAVGMGLPESDGFSRDVWNAAMEAWPEEAAALRAEADLLDAATGLASGEEQTNG